jgi:hypothetical protein
LGVCAAISRGAVFGGQPETADGPGFLSITDRKSLRRTWPVESLGREIRLSGDRGETECLFWPVGSSRAPVRDEACSPESSRSRESRFAR